MATVVEGSRPAGPAWPTGVASLDAALGGGVPRGRITEVVGAMGAGKATLIRETVARVLASGGWVAWVDARRTAAPQSWAGLGARLVMVRPPDARRGAWCADLLLRSGVFALVVLDGAPPLSRVQGVRLAGLARDRDAACVVMGEAGTTSRLTGTLRLRVERHAQIPHRTPTSHPAQAVAVTLEKGGAHRTVEVQSAVVVARRLCAHSEIPDRRGVARGARLAWTPRGGHTSDESRTVTWGGLGASVSTVRSHEHVSGHVPGHASDATHATRHAAHAGAAGPAAADTSQQQQQQRHERDLDRRTRDWAAARKRRRAADTSYGRRSRRDDARDRIRDRVRALGHALGHAAAGVG